LCCSESIHHLHSCVVQNQYTIYLVVLFRINVLHHLHSCVVQNSLQVCQCYHPALAPVLVSAGVWLSRRREGEREDKISINNITVQEQRLCFGLSHFQFSNNNFSCSYEVCKGASKTTKNIQYKIPSKLIQRF
jgi:hypothetical protein